MRKKYTSPLFAELVLEDVLFSSEDDIVEDFNDADDPNWNEDDFDVEEGDFNF